MKNKLSNRLLNALVLTGIVLTLFTLFITPLVLTAFFKASEFNPTNPNAVLIASASIYTCAAPYVVALFMLKSICRSVSRDNAFVVIAKRFVGIAICAFAEAVVFLGVQLVLCLCFDAFMLALTVIPTIVVLFVSITAGFLALVFASVFRSAAAIKEENDLTF